MNRYKLQCTAVLLLACVTGCHAQVQQPSPEFRAVFATISSDKILKTSYATVMKQLHGLCLKRQGSDQESLEKGNVACADATAVDRLDLSATDDPALSIVQSSFRGKEKCAYMKAELTKLYGKPVSAKGNCDSQWRPKVAKGKPAQIVGIEASKNDDIVYFTYEEEQGP